MGTINRFWGRLLVLHWVLLVSAIFFVSTLAEASPPNTGTPVASQVKLQQMMLFHPLSFVPNQGQAPPEVKYYATSSQRAILLTREGLELRLATPESGTGLQTVRLSPVGLNPQAELTPLSPLAGKVNYFKGRDPQEWRTNLPTYGAVLYREAYPGIDLKFYGNGRQFEYDVIVKPGADPSQVRFTADGVQHLVVNDQGELVLTLPGGGSITQKKPVVYQEINGRRVPREGRFQVAAGKPGTYGFALGPYDSRYPLVIDPLVVVYSTTLGGSSDDLARGVAVDQNGNTYLTGYTYAGATNFPVTPGAYQTTPGGFQDALVIKLGPNGVLLAATFLGGDKYDEGNAIALDSSGNVYVVGQTEGGSFPVTVGAYRTTPPNSMYNVFVAKLNNTLSSLLYSTYLGGTGEAEQWGTAIAVNQSGEVYVTGRTDATDFPIKNAFQATTGGSRDAFVAKINPNNTGEDSLVYSSYLGGSGTDDARAIAVDSSGAAYVAGSTYSSNFPTEKPYQGKMGTWDNAFITKILPDGSGLVYSTYLGGSSGNGADGIAVDGAGAAYVTGSTSSTDFPLANPIQDTLGGPYDAYISKLALVGNTLTLVYSTYLGGSEGDWATAVAVDGSGAAYILGGTESSDFPVLNPIPGYTIGGFVTKVNPGGTAWVYSTPLAVNENAGIRCIAVDRAGQVCVAGRMGPNPTDVLALKWRETTNIGGSLFLLLH